MVNYLITFSLPNLYSIESKSAVVVLVINPICAHALNTMNIQNITSEVLAQLSSLQLKSAQLDSTEPYSTPYPLTNLLDNLHKFIQEGNGETIIHINSGTFIE